MSDSLAEITEEFKVVGADGRERGWAVGPRPKDDPGYDWMAYWPEPDGPEFAFGACPGDETPDRAVAKAKAEYARRGPPS
jgi:hypothetical protein